MKFTQDIKFYLVLTTLVAISMGILFQKSIVRENKLKTELSKTKQEMDSLETYLFLFEAEYNRFAIAYDIFYEKNPKAAEEFDYILSNETE
jgi:hypothetical protein